ncbi:hypothetical protein MFUM_1010064 [Methylacidiphilum fumariolicum SolV]|uniref:Uncharacterized protein n=2 Tax=Candidatus Methylacidiphilum fumarolicum TaxID=591154 RepID=I0JVH1_METFB|nr:conserved protein of unknown function [Candidatus Methylacidiphilum fumarolicum]CCG91240.1 hypothetical protein MFUM_1010064 [Methylacidiphilum fumariolicum SolV]
MWFGDVAYVYATYKHDKSQTPAITPLQVALITMPMPSERLN